MAVAGARPSATPSPSKAAKGPDAASIARGVNEDAPPDKPVGGHAAIPQDAPDMAAGRAVFLQRCASCHGVDGRGDGPAGKYLDPHPRNFHTEKIQYGADAAHLFTTVWLGAKHWKGASATSGMAGFKGRMPKAQVLQVLAYLKHTLMGKP
jgi:mono/diheme cytochrome c family protein